MKEIIIKSIKTLIQEKSDFILVRVSMLGDTFHYVLKNRYGNAGCFVENITVDDGNSFIIIEQEDLSEEGRLALGGIIKQKLIS